MPSRTTGSPCMFCPLATTDRARVVSNARPGDRQAALGAVLLVGRQVEDGVDEVAEHTVDPVGEDAQSDADLRCGQPGARGVEHGVLEVLDQHAQLLVEVGDLGGGGAQDRVAEESDVLDRHDVRSSGLGEAGTANPRGARCGAPNAARTAGRARVAQTRYPCSTPTPTRPRPGAHRRAHRGSAAHPAGLTGGLLDRPAERRGPTATAARTARSRRRRRR